MGIELSQLVQEMGERLCVEVNADSGARVDRMAPLSDVLTDPPADLDRGILVLAGTQWLQNIDSTELRLVLMEAKSRGMVGLVTSDLPDISEEVTNVFRQLKLLLAAVPSGLTEEPRAIPSLYFQLQAVLDREVQQNQNRLSIVEELLAALNDQNPISSLIRQLGRHCQGSALLYDSVGKIVESTGSAPANLVNSELSRRELSEGLFEVGRWSVIGRDVSIRTQSYVLVLASRSRGPLDELGPFLLDSVANLLGTFQSLDSFAMVQQVQHSAHLLKELELGIPLGREMQYWDRLREYGFTSFSPLRFVTAATANHRLLTTAELESIAQFAARSATPVLVSENTRTSELPPGFHMLAQESPALEQWLMQRSGTMSVGVSAPYSELSRSPEMCRSAQLAENMGLRRLRASQNSLTSVVYVDRLSPAEYLLSRAYSHRDQAPLEEYIVKLQEHPDLLDSLVAYFSHGMKVAETAQALGVHQNTLRYRLTKIANLLGTPLSEPATIANLYLALYEELSGAAQT